MICFPAWVTPPVDSETAHSNSLADEVAKLEAKNDTVQAQCSLICHILNLLDVAGDSFISLPHVF